MTAVYCTAAQVANALGLGWDDTHSVGSNTQVNSIFAPTTAGQIYAVGDEVRLRNDDGVTEDATVSGVTYGSSYTTLTVGSLTNMALFTTANFTSVQVKSYFTGLSQPTKSMVEEWIEESQDEIDLYTKRSWMGATSGAGPLKTMYLPWHPNYPVKLYDIKEFFKVRLPYPNIITPLAIANGDSLKVWNGSTETEYVGVKTESRGGDFWFDEKGFLMINAERPWPGVHSVKLTARFGATTVPASIRRACIMMTCNKFMESNLYNNQPLAEGATSETWPYSNARGYSWGKIQGILKHYRRMLIA